MTTAAEFALDGRPRTQVMTMSKYNGPKPSQTPATAGAPPPESAQRQLDAMLRTASAPPTEDLAPVGYAHQLMRVTPELAAQWLTRNLCNRPLRRAHVEDLARKMRLGFWRINGQSICFDRSGNLIVGQHRLHAVVLAGVAVLMDVVFGADADAALTSNGGARGLQGDVLREQPGLSSHHNIASWLRLIEAYETGTTKPLNLAPQEQRRCFEEHEAAVRWGLSVYGAPKGREHLRRACVMAPLVYAYGVYLPQTEVFSARLRDGANLAAGSPIMALRECPAARFDEVQPYEMSLRVLQCIAKFVQGKSLRVLRTTPEGLEFFTRAYTKRAGR